MPGQQAIPVATMPVCLGTQAYCGPIRPAGAKFARSASAYRASEKRSRSEATKSKGVRRGGRPQNPAKDNARGG
jgi:hypothetical protein